MSQPPDWEMWVDFTRVYDGLTYGDLEDIAPGTVVEPGRHLVVGDYDAEPAVAQVIEVKADGRVMPSSVNRSLITAAA